jgi:hypothetical protein
MEANAPRPDLPHTRPSESPPPGQQKPSDPVPETQKTPMDNRFPSSTEDSSPVASYAYVIPPILLLALLGAVPLTKRLLAARGRPEDLYRDLTGRLRDVMPFSGAAVADSPALTPNERLLLLAGVAGLEAEPFHEFARAYSESLYAPDPRLNTACAYRGALQEYKQLSRWKRVLGAFNPASLFLRARRALVTLWIGLKKALRRRKER